jgi:hypothetical protein
MIVELYGLPASGKSTLARKMAEDEGYIVVKAGNKAELLFYNLLFFIKHPLRAAVTFYYLIINSKSRQLFYYKFMNTFLHTNAKYQKALRHEKAVLDQGYFQNVISVFESRLTEREMLQYLRFVLFPDKLIIFSLSQKKRDQFAGSRGYLAREQFGGKYQENWRKVAEHNDKMLKQALKKLPINYSIQL